MVSLPGGALREKARLIRLVLTDCDGVLTDGGVYYGENGEALKRFHIRDGMGVERLRLAGIETGIVTGELSPSVQRRADKLKIRELHLGASDKLSVLMEVCRRRELTLDRIAFVGDDVNDREALERVGLSACPADAFHEVRSAVDLVLESRGGHGAFREFAELLLGAQRPA